MRWLSKSFETLLADIETARGAGAGSGATTDRVKPHFDAVIVGSGYGGAVAACRMAEAGLKVAVLERGREYQPGEFPNDIAELPGHLRIDRAGHPGPGRTAEGLFDLRLHRGVTVLLGNGLGGGSLINANVALRADPRVFQDPRWPRPLRESYDPLDGWYTRAEDMLGVSQYPHPCRKAEQLQRLETPLTRWLQAHDSGSSGPKPEAVFFRAPLAVNWHEAERNRFGAPQGACTGCGDCVTGCNIGAKNTLATNYLAKAYRHGACLYTGVSALAVKPAARVQAGPRAPGLLWFCASDIDWSSRFSEDRYCDEQTLDALGIDSLTADIVVLAAGSLGSTEILLRSRQLGLLTTSTRLGAAFSGNADGIHFGYDQTEAVAAIGLGSAGARVVRRKGEHDPGTAPGPAIVGVLDLRGGVAAAEGMLIEDGIVPGALHGVTHELVTSAAMLQQLGSMKLRHSGAGEDPLALNDKALRHTQVYLAMGHDAADGSMALEAGRLIVTQAERSQAQAAQRQKAIVQRAAEVLGGIGLPNPFFEPLPEALTQVLEGPPVQGQGLVVHPLGGCPMGDDCASGVVDQHGAVYDGLAPRSVHDSLFVWDGSIVPMSLGANPFLTITALAERAVDHLLCLRGQAEAASAASRQPPRQQVLKDFPRRRAVAAPFGKAEPARVAMRLRETLRGRLRLADGADSPEVAAALRLRMDIPDMLALLKRHEHRIDQIGGEFHCDLPQAAYGVHRAESSPHGDLKVLSGTVEMLVQVPEHALVQMANGLLAWWHKRGSSEWQTLFRRLFSGRQSWRSLPRSLFLTLALAKHAGTRRQFRYVLQIGRPAPTASAKSAEAEVCFVLTGAKNIRFAADSNIWEALLELPVTLSRARDGEAVAQGVLRLDLVDFAENGAPQILRGADAANGLLALASLPLFFLRVILATHLWDFKAPAYRAAAREAPIPGQRPLLTPRDLLLNTPAGQRTVHPERHYLRVPWSLSDGGAAEGYPPSLELLLTRLQPPPGSAGAGHRTPVLMLAGFAQSASAFLAARLPEDLVRHLLAAGFEVWLLDYRTSTALPYSRLACSLDDVATVDIPHAVEFIRRATGLRQIMAIGHCMGSATLSMSMLAGALHPDRLAVLEVPGDPLPVPDLTGEAPQSALSAAVLSQVPPYVVGGHYSQWRQQLAALFRDVLGVDVVNLAADAGASAAEVVMDRVFATLPTERPAGRHAHEGLRGKHSHGAVDGQLAGGCPDEDATCQRVMGFIGPLYRHENIRIMHPSLDQYFGWANVDVFNQIARFFEFERLVSAEGANIYVTDENIWKHLRLPIGLLHGECNEVFSVESTRRTLRHLQRIHGSPGAVDIHEAIVIPGYCHFDCLIGDRAAVDVFPKVSGFLGRHVAGSAVPTFRPGPPAATVPEAPLAQQI